MKTQVTTSPVDNLIAGSFPQMSKLVTLLAGYEYKRGDVLEINADGKAVHLETANKAKYVLAQNYGTPETDVPAVVYTTGQFYADECNFNGKLAEDAEDVLHARSIFLV